MPAMDAFYELFDHTADMGIRVCAPTLGGLLKPAAEGLYAAIGDLVGIGAGRAERFDLGGEDAAGLLRDYLAELLILFERENRIVTAIDAADFTETHLKADATARAVDEERSIFLREVKAITYHDLAVRTIPGGFEARVIVDI